MRISILSFAALVLLCATPALAQDDKTAALEERLLKECNAGKGASCGNYGVALGNRKDFEGAHKYSEKACQMGSQISCTYAQTYANRLRSSAPQLSANTSAAELQSACSKDNGKACSFHAYNLGVAKNWSQALIYARKGCELGDDTACQNMLRFTRNKERDDEYAQRQAQARAQQQQQTQQEKRSTDYSIPESAYSDADVSGRRSNYRHSTGGYVGSGNGAGLAYKPREQVCTESYTSSIGTNSNQRIVKCR